MLTVQKRGEHRHLPEVAGFLLLDVLEGKFLRRMKEKSLSAAKGSY